MASIAVVRCGGTLLEQRHPRFECSDLLSLHVLVHTLPLQPPCTRTLTSTRPFGLGGFERSDDKVVKFG